MTLFKKLCFLYLKLLWNKTLAYINQSYNQGIDIKSQKPGNSGVKPGTVFAPTFWVLLAYWGKLAKLLWRVDIENNLKRNSLFFTDCFLPVSSYFSVCVQRTLLFSLPLWISLFNSAAAGMKISTLLHKLHLYFKSVLKNTDLCTSTQNYTFRNILNKRTLEFSSFLASNSCKKCVPVKIVSTSERLFVYTMNICESGMGKML